MVFLSMCYSLFVNMPWTHTRVIGEGGGWRGGVASILEVFRVLAQTRSLNKRVVESQKKWKEGPSFI